MDYVEFGEWLDVHCIEHFLSAPIAVILYRGHVVAYVWPENNKMLVVDADEIVGEENIKNLLLERYISTKAEKPINQNLEKLARIAAKDLKQEAELEQEAKLEQEAELEQEVVGQKQELEKTQVKDEDVQEPSSGNAMITDCVAFIVKVNCSGIYGYRLKFYRKRVWLKIYRALENRQIDTRNIKDINIEPNVVGDDLNRHYLFKVRVDLKQGGIY